MVGEDGTEYETPGVNPNDLVDLLSFIPLMESITGLPERFGVLHEGSDIPEHDPFDGPVWDCSYRLFQIHDNSP